MLLIVGGGGWVLEILTLYLLWISSLIQGSENNGSIYKQLLVYVEVLVYL